MISQSEDDRVQSADSGSRTETALANPCGISDPADHSALPISLFLMVNSFETGGSERQFTVLAQNLATPQFQTHLGCVMRRGPLEIGRAHV